MGKPEEKTAPRAATAPVRDREVAAVMDALRRAVSEYALQSCEIGYRDRIDKWLSQFSDLYEEVDIVEFGGCVEKQTGVSLDQKDWDFLSGLQLCKSPTEWEARYAALFTFGSLAELIAQRLMLPSVDAVNIFGQLSKSAGAFRAIQRVLEADRPDLDPIAPSTPVLDRFVIHKDLLPVWAKFRVMSHGRLPELRFRSLGKWIDLLAVPVGCLVSCGAAAGVMYMMRQLNFDLPISVAGAALTVAVLVWGMRLLQKLYDAYQRLTGRSAIRLPVVIETFGDVARIIAGERGGWCNECGYDLTGVVDNRCPECGAASKPSFVFPTRPDQSRPDQSQLGDSKL